MLLIEMTAVPETALPVAQFRDHLRLGSGFVDEGAEDALLQALLRAAIAAVEARTSKALLARAFAATLRTWSGPDRQTLPVAPVSAVTRLVRIDAIDSETEVDTGAWRFVADAMQPAIEGTGGMLPSIPAGGSVRLEFTGGYGPSWSDLPADIALAVLMLAATYYEHRFEARASADIMPHGVTALLEPHRAVRVGLGGGRR